MPKEIDLDDVPICVEIRTMRCPNCDEPHFVMLGEDGEALIQFKVGRENITSFCEMIMLAHRGWH